MYVCVYVCRYVHVPDFEDIPYALPLPPNDTASEAFLHKSGAVGSAY